MSGWANTLDWDSGDTPLQDYDASKRSVDSDGANVHSDGATSIASTNDVEMQATSTSETTGSVPTYSSTSALVAQIMSAPTDTFGTSAPTHVELHASQHVHVLKENLAKSTFWEWMPLQQCMVEFFGSFFICWFAVIIGYNPDKMHLIGFAAAVLTYLAGHISGGHFNPAITVAVYLRGKIDRNAGILYIVSQVLGAIVGSLISFGFYANTNISVRIGYKQFYLSPHQAFGIPAVCFVEFFYTFVLCVLFMTLTSTRANQDNDHYELMYGLYYSSALMVTVNISKGYLNPAVAIGLVINTALEEGPGAGVGADLWVYLLFELFAGFAAGKWFRVINRKDNNHNLTPPLGRNQNVHQQGTQPEI